MKMKYTLLAGLIASSLSTQTLAQDIVQTLENADQNVNAIVVSHEDTADAVESKIGEYIAQKEQLIEAANKSHLIRFFGGQAEISVTTNHPDWAVYRAMALAEAMHRARDSYLKTLNRDFVEEQVRETFHQHGLPEPTAKDFQSDNRFQQLLGKAVALFDGHLSKELEKFGISAPEFAQAPPEKKQILMQQYFENRSISKAYGDLSGMFVTKTYEQYDESGKGTIGVVMTLSLNKRDKVVDLINSKGDVQPDPTRKNPTAANLKEYFKNQSVPYMNAGTDLMYDAQGYPMLVSFGQYGVVHTSDRDMRSIEREAAEGFAEDAAWSALASAYNLSGDFARESIKRTAKEKSRTTTLIGPDATRTAEGSLQRTVQTTSTESSKMTSSLKQMTGVSIEHKWRAKHPATGHEMVGVVLVWHPIKVQNTVKMQSGARADELEKPTSSNASPSNLKTESESADRFDLSDF
ncbi:hypothetical protein LZU85_00235 [Vibrio sp. IRLE0018]|uniref:DUF6844 domain-containing protein n=1 Tax=Vibrio floridensis TaxID=2908007 RepID=UPI001F277233|nr:hypothetical protein [Vibrio floridensis]MCF8777210.1 hypothetical protein [Vibrio floridensis]